MPGVITERAAERGEDFRTEGLVERGAESTRGHHAQPPRKAASLDSTVVRRRIRRPPEPGGDRKVRGGNGNRGSRDSVSPFGEVPPHTVFPRVGCCPRDPPISFF